MEQKILAQQARNTAQITPSTYVLTKKIVATDVDEINFPVRPHVVDSKPYTAVTVQIDRLTSEQYEENDLGGIFDLVEVIRLQSSGPTEAARALRKKLKYGNVHRQLRALTILDGLIQNGGSRFQMAFADEPLLDRLRVLARDDVVDAQVKAKCNILFRQWAHAYKNTPGLQSIASLYQQLPNRRTPQPSQSKVIRETEAEAEQEARNDPFAGEPSTSSDRKPSRPINRLTPTPSSSSQPVTLSSAPDPYGIRGKHKDKKSKAKPFSLEREKPKLLETIASASVASTNLLNALKLINRENKRVSEDPEVIKRFETCKVLRRQILRYIQLVESDQWIGSLLSANDELVKALMAYEIMDKSIDDDSDSEGEWEEPAAASMAKTSSQKDVEEALASLSLKKPPPPRPSKPAGIGIPPRPPPMPASGKQKVKDSESEPEEDEFEEGNPFGDQNAVEAPYVGKSGITWRDV